MIIYDYHFYSSLKIDLEFYRVIAAHPDRCDRSGYDTYLDLNATTVAI